MRRYFCCNPNSFKDVVIFGWNYSGKPSVWTDVSFGMFIPLKHLFERRFHWSKIAMITVDHSQEIQKVVIISINLITHIFPNDDKKLELLKAQIDMSLYWLFWHVWWEFIYITLPFCPLSNIWFYYLFNEIKNPVFYICFNFFLFSSANRCHFLVLTIKSLCELSVKLLKSFPSTCS